MVRSRLSFLVFEGAATQDFSRSPRSDVPKGSSRISLQIASDVVANEARKGLKTVDISAFCASKAE